MSIGGSATGPDRSALEGVGGPVERASQRAGTVARRRVLTALAAGAAVACGPSLGVTPAPKAPGAPDVAAVPTIPVIAEVPTPVPASAAPVAPPLPRVPALSKLGLAGISQPFFSGDGGRVLFYDQPEPGQGGTWSFDLGSGRIAREREHWGYYVAQASLVATPRPQRRDTVVHHIASGREWTLPTSSATVFSGDGTLVAYSSGGLVLAGADNQYARKVTLPVNGTVLAWTPAADGTPNGRLLVSGRRTPGDDPGLWVADPQRRAATQLVRSKRLTGILPSCDGTWVAYLAMWNADASEDGLWVARTDGSVRHRLSLLGSYRWTADNRLLVIPPRESASSSHSIWEIIPSQGGDAPRRLTEPATLPFRLANCDWDCSPDGTQIVFVSGEDRGLWHLTLPAEAPRELGVTPPALAAPPSAGGSNGKPYRLPFTTAPGPSSWYVGQWYGLTTGGYRWRNSTYVQGQGIHFGIDFATAYGTPVVAIAPGTVIAVDGDYGSPPHNVVIRLDDGNIAVYGHLFERTRHVNAGDRVTPGQVVGNSGDSLFPYDGSKNPHLHLEIRKQGRAVATNPVPFFDAVWDDLPLGAWPGALFEKNLDAPKANQFLDDQPDIWFGGPLIDNFARPWPV